ncbi:MAG: hypothetical protein ACHQF4_09750 [Sphingobacteriales bacterium]
MANRTSNNPVIEDKIIQFLETLKTDLVNSMQAKGTDASGQTAKQLTITIDCGKTQLEMPGYIQLLETGRGPTNKNAVASNPPMLQRIQQWCREQGIPDKAAWAIKKSIDKKGFKGKPGILSEPLGDDNINFRLKNLLDCVATVLDEQIKPINTI